MIITHSPAAFLLAPPPRLAAPEMHAPLQVRSCVAWCRGGVTLSLAEPEMAGPPFLSSAAPRQPAPEGAQASAGVTDLWPISPRSHPVF